MNKNLGLLIMITVAVTACSVFIFIQLSPSHQAKEVINNFYRYEQEGRFAESWELFHSQMKDKFDKGHYIQDRAHVFMNHFDVVTFEYSLSGVNKKTNWKMAKGSKALDTVYQVTVTQIYKGKYGNFEIKQEVFATKEKGNWRVLWNYKK